MMNIDHKLKISWDKKKEERAISEISKNPKYLYSYAKFIGPVRNEEGIHKGGRKITETLTKYKNWCFVSPKLP